MKTVYLISNIEEYGKLISFCIEKDISVWRSYWDEREKGIRCYEINFKEKRCYYSSDDYYREHGYSVVKPEFYLDEFGKWKIK